MYQYFRGILRAKCSTLLPKYLILQVDATGVEAMASDLNFRKPFNGIVICLFQAKTSESVSRIRMCDSHGSPCCPSNAQLGILAAFNLLAARLLLA